MTVLPSPLHRATRALPVLASALASLVLLAPSAGAQVRPGGGGFGGGARPAAPSQDAAFEYHVLNRLTFGPSEESLAAIRAMGADTFIWQQTHPQTVDDSVLDGRLGAEIPAGADAAYIWKHFLYEVPLRYATSQRQLQEVMTQFWDNHFDTVVPYGNNDIEQHLWVKMEKLEQDAFRANAFGRFRDLLEISAKSQAMMYFLDNYQNTFGLSRGNENYARELLELHSLGVDCGYDQFDVEQVARIFTGWTGRDLPQRIDYTDPNTVVEGDFVFNAPRHDNWWKPDPNDPDNPRSTVLGTTFPPGGNLAEGERVLDIVTRHPCTARFIATKLLELFVTDTPSPKLVDEIASVFLDTEQEPDHMAQVLRAIFQSAEFRDPANFGGKVRTPLEYTLASLRGMGATIDIGGGNDWEYRFTYSYVAVQGMNLFNYPIPTGFAERAPTWISANGFLQRWKYAERLAVQWGNPALPVSTDPMAVTRRLGLDTANEVIDHFTQVLIGTTVTQDRRDLLRQNLLQGQPEFNPSAPGQDARLREVISQILGFPEFNEQ